MDYNNKNYEEVPATELMPEFVREKLLKHPIDSTTGPILDAEVIVKYFNPFGRGRWLIIEGEEQNDGDWTLFGLCHIYEWEWGTVLLSELQNAKLPYGRRIERDLHSRGVVKELRE